MAAGETRGWGFVWRRVEGRGLCMWEVVRRVMVIASSESRR